MALGQGLSVQGWRREGAITGESQGHFRSGEVHAWLWHVDVSVLSSTFLQPPLGAQCV